MNNAPQIGRILGVPLRVHWTVPVLVFLLGYSLGAGTLPDWVPGRSRFVYTAVGVVGALLLVLSLLARELAHAVVARRSGIPVHDITLWALGGVTGAGRPTAPGPAFLVAVSGPLASLVLGGAALGTGAGLNAGPGWAMPAAVMVWLGWANLLLGVFNLLPAAPLDGGRVIQSVMWWHTGNRQRAEAAAGRGGQIIGVLLMALGWVAVLRGALGGLWLVCLGFFIVVMGKAERQQAALSTALNGLRAADAMSSPVETAPDWATVRQFVDGPASATRHMTLPLLDFEGRPTGLLHLPLLSRIPAAQWETLRLRDAATPLARCATCAPDDLLADAVGRLRPRHGGHILVVDGRHLTGIVTAHDVMRLAQSRRLREDRES
ncbi:site-2 protease family protein [Streptomyces griseorubiginosus]|uniref:site-2 protease family protein n=1 Tax=Streptomyces griseorubiginosus TaxID=67304 RepID=UPI0036BE0B76